MKFNTLPIVLALGASIPSTLSYSFGGLRFVRPSVLVSRPTDTFFDEFNDLRDALLVNRRVSSSLPSFEIINTDEKFQIAVDVPGINPDDMDVSIDNNVLTLSGKRQEQSDNYSYSSKFSQSFSLDPTIDTDKVTASLSHGVLTVSAPKEWKQVTDTVKKIPITGAAETESAKIDVLPATEASHKVEVKAANDVTEAPATTH